MDISVLLVLILILVIVYFFSKRSSYSHTHPVLDHIRRVFVCIDDRYKDIVLRIGNSSHTLNKSVISLCIYQPGTDILYDLNTLVYVALHELAHVASVTEHHTPEFKKNFVEMLEKAEKCGFFDPKRPLAKSYCGVEM
mgnify:CR=1 FL=1